MAEKPEHTQKTASTNSQRSNLRRLLLGMIVGNGVAVVMCLVAAGVLWWANNDPGGTASLVSAAAIKVFTWPSLCMLPMVIGFCAAWVWKPLEPTVGQVLLYSFWCTIVGLAMATIFLREGVVCLLIISPLIYGGIIAGALIWRAWFSRGRGKVNVWLAPFVALMVVIEPAFREAHQSVVTDEIRINASPKNVWPHVLAFTTIPAPPDFWLFRVGLPYPSETMNAGNFAGASRTCRFSENLDFKETISEFEPGRRLTFEIVEVPPHPELLGHLNPYRGQFELRDNGDGTTTLVGRTWYNLYVRPAWYFDLWTHHIFRAVHLRVMHNVQQLAEARR